MGELFCHEFKYPTCSVQIKTVIFRAAQEALWGRNWQQFIAAFMDRLLRKFPIILFDGVNSKSWDLDIEVTFGDFSLV
jgi:hypothetical protein